MIKKNAEIDAIEKTKEDIDNQSILNPRIVHKKRKSSVGVVLRIAFIYFPLGVTLAAFALPFFIGCGVANKAKESEPKQYVGAMNRAQQAYLAENGRFANSVDALGIGIKTQTSNFRYSVNATKTAAFGYGIPHPPEYTIYFGPFHWNNKVELRGYVGAVFLVTNNYTKETSTVAITCVTKSPTKTQPANPILNNGNLTCANGTDPVTK